MEETTSDNKIHNKKYPHMLLSHWDHNVRLEVSIAQC
jgi:hypothetical protein